MQIENISNTTQTKRILQELGVDSGGINILASKMDSYILYIRDLHVGAANILKQDALSIGADLAVPRGTVVAKEPRVDCILIATKKQLMSLSKKELAQPFGLKELAQKLSVLMRTQVFKKIQIMGVLNVNEDSFFKESRYQDTQALTKIHSMLDEGADIIDLGAVSSRPNAPKVDSREELLRIKPLLDTIKKSKLYEQTSFSIDSYSPNVIEYALESGFKIVNDITGLRDDEVCKLCASYKAKAVMMHMQGTPQTMQDNPEYRNILSDVYNFFDEGILKAEGFGIKDIVLDIGIGFGKTLEDNLILIKYLEHFKSLNKELLVGVSRKSMIDKLSPSDVEDRLPGTLALHLEAIENGASIVRVHDVAEHLQAIRMKEALLNI